MLLNVVRAEYIKQHQISLDFNNGDSVLVNLEKTIFNDHRKIFEPLRGINYFRNFKLKLNTIVWENEADFAPEFLLELGKQQQERELEHA